VRGEGPRQEYAQSIMFQRVISTITPQPCCTFSSFFSTLSIIQFLMEKTPQVSRRRGSVFISVLTFLRDNVKNTLEGNALTNDPLV